MGRVGHVLEPLPVAVGEKMIHGFLIFGHGMVAEVEINVYIYALYQHVLVSLFNCTCPEYLVVYLIGSLLGKFVLILQIRSGQVDSGSGQVGPIQMSCPLTPCGLGQMSTILA